MIEAKPQAVLCAQGPTAREAVVRVSGSGVKLLGLTVVQPLGSEAHDPGCPEGSPEGSLGAVQVEASAVLFMEHCSLQSEQGVGAWIAGTAHVADTTVRGCRWAGVVVSGTTGFAKLSRCCLQDNAGPGGQVEEKGTLSLSHCRIERNAQGGLVAQGRGAGSWEHCEVVENQGCGVEVLHEADPVLQESHVGRNQHTGVRVHAAGWGTIKHNTIVDNGGAGLLVETQGDPTVEANTIQGNAAGQIVIEKGGWGTIRGQAPGDIAPPAPARGGSRACSVS